MTKKSKIEKELNIFRKSIEKATEKDFDGHTNFQDLSPREKIIWLSELNYFKNIVKKISLE